MGEYDLKALDEVLLGMLLCNLSLTLKFSFYSFQAWSSEWLWTLTFGGFMWFWKMFMIHNSWA